MISSTSPFCNRAYLQLISKVGNKVTDKPHLYHGGWVNNRLQPNTVYYYRVAAVDRWNNQGELSQTIEVKTQDPGEKNMLPLKVEALRQYMLARSQTSTL